MSTTPEPTQTPSQRYGWAIMFATGIILSLNYVYLVFYLEDPMLGLGFLGLSLFATSIAYFPYRRGERWAWYTMWIVPAVMILATLREFATDQPGIGLLYLGFTALALVGLLLPFRVFFPRN